MRPGTRADARERELARLGDVFAGVGESGLRLALVEGPAGVGKRRVVTAFCDRSRAAGAVVVEGSCLRDRPHAPFEAIVEQAVSELRRTGARGVPLSDLGCPDGCHALWFQHRGPRAGEIEHDVTIARRCLHGAVSALLDAVATVRPMVIALHDIEDADAESLELVGHLLDAVPALGEGATRLMIVATAREGASEADGLRAHPRTVRVRIDALDRDGLRALLQSPEYLARLLASTGGLPAAVERLLASDPPSAEEHLLRRLAGLGAEARAVFDALAVLARPATAEELAFVASSGEGLGDGAESLGVAGAISDLFAAQLVREDIGSGRVALADSDDAERVRAKLPPEWRRSREQRCVALCLRGPRDAAEAVRHAVRAGLAAEALELWKEASEALAARHADAMAAELLQGVAELAGDDAPVALHARLAELRLSTGEFRLALRSARRALAACPKDPAAARRVAQALVLAGDLPEAARVVSHARKLVDPDVAADLGATLAELLYQNGELDEARAVSVEVLASHPPLEAELCAMQTMAKVALAAGELDVSERLYADYENRARATSSLRHEALAMGGRGVALLTRGALPEAERALRRCSRLAEQANDRKGQALAWHNLAVAAHLGHDYATARSRYEEALRLLRLVGNRSSLARAAYNLGELYETLGDRRRARTMCDFGAQVGGTSVAPRAAAEGLLLRARIELAEGNTVQARAAFEAARELLDRVDPLRAAAAIVGMARVHLHDGRVDDAARMLEQVPAGVAAARRTEAALTRVTLARARGGDPMPAAGDAVRAAEESGDDLLRVEALVELATVLRDRGDHGRAVEVAATAAELDARVGERVPEDLAAAWDDRPMRRRLLSIAMRGPPAFAPGAARPALSPRPPTAPTPPGGPRPASGEPWTSSSRNGIRPERQSSPELAPPRFTRLVGDSPAIRRVGAIVERVGRSKCTVLLTGESGTGKELVAEALHESSPRHAGPLVRVNCAALVETLLVSELFGHEKGAFTGAHERKKGRFELAHGGTLFLDEIGDISPAVQAALLRVLQERRFERVGGRESIDVDVRIVAATNRDLEAMVRAGTFREDLYYRLNEVRIEMPPLRERRSDVPALVAHLLGRVAEERGEPEKRVSAEALELLAHQSWPGNVRQLENALRVASLFADGSLIETVHLNGTLTAVSAGAAADTATDRPVTVAADDDGPDPYDRVRSGELSLRALKKEIERSCIERALVECDGNISKAAGVLGMKRPRLSQLVKEYGLLVGDEG